MKRFERVHTMTDFYDGPRGGVADFEGRPHAYASQFSDSEGYADMFFLMPIEEEVFRLALEDWAIWLRWEQAFREGRTSQGTHPTLPEDRPRHEELKRMIGDRLTPMPNVSRKARAEFRSASKDALEVSWTLIPE